MIQRSAFVMALLALAPLDAGARSADPPRDVDLVHTLALADSGASRLDFRLTVPYQRLVFRRDAEGFAAKLRVAVRAREKDSRREENLLFSDGARSATFAESRRKDLSFEREFHVDLGPGKYAVEVSIFARGDDRAWTYEFEASVPDSKAGDLFLQGPQWLASPGEEVTPPFRFRDPWGIPADRAHFVDAAVNRIGLECALHSWSEADRDVELLLRLESVGGELVYYDRRRLDLGPGERKLRWELPVSRLAMGAYLLEVELVAPGQTQRVRGRLDVGLARAAFDREWDRTVDLLRPLAEAAELRELSNAPRELRQAKWLEFWSRRGPRGGQNRAAALETFCERISESNARFGTLRRPGYGSDRGQVFLEHGEPDRVERYEDERYYRTLESWTYGRLGLVYLFEDRHGAGEYTLVSVSGS